MTNLIDKIQTTSLLLIHQINKLEQENNALFEKTHLKILKIDNFYNSFSNKEELLKFINTDISKNQKINFKGLLTIETTTNNPSAILIYSYNTAESNAIFSMNDWNIIQENQQSIVMYYENRKSIKELLNFKNDSTPSGQIYMSLKKLAKKELNLTNKELNYILNIKKEISEYNNLSRIFPPHHNIQQIFPISIETYNQEISKKNDKRNTIYTIIGLVLTIVGIIISLKQ